MANTSHLTGYINLEAQDVAEASTTLLHTLGRRALDTNGNEYVYLQGVASGADKAAVSYDEAYVTTLATTGAYGRVAILQSDMSGTGIYGWGLIYGSGSVTVAATVADNALVYSGTTAGQLDDSSSSQTQIKGAVFRSTGTASGATAKIELNYPTMSIS